MLGLSPLRGLLATMIVRFKLHPDQSASLACVRDDGTSTWQRQNGALGMVFPPHDLTHFAVETTLGYARGFFGLVAEGWDIADFAKPWPRGPIPREAQEVELIVGFFDTERRSLGRMTEAEFNDHAERYVAGRRSAKGASLGAAPPPRLTADQIDAVRRVRGELLARWGALKPGEVLELEFVRSPASSRPP